MVWRGIAWCNAWPGIWYGLAGLGWYNAWPGNAWHGIWNGLADGMVYGMAWRAWHGIRYVIVGMAWNMIKPGGHCIWYGLLGMECY